MHELPHDIIELIVQHWAAMRLQRRWIRFSHYGHARKRSWPTVRAHLSHLGAWPRLISYPRIRREWRSECESWLHADDGVAIAVGLEAQNGHWGRPTASFREIERRAIRRPVPRFPQRLLAR